MAVDNGWYKNDAHIFFYAKTSEVYVSSPADEPNLFSSIMTINFGFANADPRNMPFLSKMI